MSETPHEPFPGYVYDAVAAARAAAIQKLARDTILALDGGSLFDTEPALIARTLLELREGAS